MARKVLLLAALLTQLQSSEGGDWSHVKHLTYYDYMPGEQHTFLTAGLGVLAGGNISSVLRVWEQYKLPSIIDVEDMGGGFDHGMYFRGGINKTHLNPKWKTLVDVLLDNKDNLAHIGAGKPIPGIFLGDEPCCGGLPVSELGDLATYIKQKVRAAQLLLLWTHYRAAGHRPVTR